MTRLRDDPAAASSRQMSLAEALARLPRRLSCAVAAETVVLAEANGRFLAEDVISGVDVPPHDNSAVDGYAVRFADLTQDGATRLPIVGRAAAGRPFGKPCQPGAAVRIFTGAPMPAGCDTVFMQEDCVVDGGHVVLPPGLKLGANRRRAGEDIAADSVAVARGRRLRPPEIAAAAAIGRASLAVYRPLRVAVLSTGDEIGEPGALPPPGGLYDANRHALLALLGDLGARTTDLGIVRDDPAALRAALAAAAEGHDLVVSSGGMSVGDEDHVKQAVGALGSLHVWQLAIKPGRPIGLGQVGGVPFVGLPGNPVAMMVTFLRVVRPMVLILSGATQWEPRVFPVTADFRMMKKAGRREWVRARLATDVAGRLVARASPGDGSAMISSMIAADGLVELPEDMTHVAPGDPVDFLPFSEVTR